MDFIAHLWAQIRKIYKIIWFFLLIILYALVFLEPSSVISVMILPFFVLIIPGYLFVEILFKQDELVDKILMGFGLSIFTSTVSFYTLLFLYQKPVDILFSRIFLAILFIECLILILVDYIYPKKVVSRNQNLKFHPECLSKRNIHLLLSILLCTIFLGQILLVKIPLYLPDEHTYVYTSQNLLQANYSFLPMPPVMDPRLWTPRYVFIGLNTISYLYFGFKLTAPHAFMVISSLILILVTFALANTLYGKKVGLIAGLYMAFNPTFWQIVRRVVPDMVVAVLLWLGIYFMIKACKHNNHELSWQYIPISGIFLGLAILVKLTVIFAVPTFFVILLVFRQKISKKRMSLFYMICLAGFISFFVIFLASERYPAYLLFILRNFSYFLDRWDWSIVYAAMIEPLLIISPVFIFCILGIVFDFKRRERAQGVIILFTAWIAYFFLPLILPEQAVDPRQVFPAHVGPSIIAAFGTVEVMKREKLWRRMLYFPILFQAFYEVWIREYVRISQVSRVLIELVLLIITLAVLRKAVQKIKLQPSQVVPKTRTVILLGLILVLLINGHALNSLGKSARIRKISLETLSATQTSLELSGRWLIANTSKSSVLMTNEFKRLPYYAGLRITYPLPEYEVFFLTEIQTKKIEYLILFWSIWSLRYPYMDKYIESAPPKTIEMARWVYTSEDGRDLGFVIYKVIIDSW
ncbi:MAG: ArnT family glycosyltransferase [Candidatus Heimdallarchaeota archaeon]